MPDFWQFPTGSMGLGPLFAIYQARFLRYLEHRGLPTQANHTSARCGPSSATARWTSPSRSRDSRIAAREGLDNLVFVVNCNLQRLDGPVRGNGSIIQELEGLFAGAGWNVIKLLWGSDWDPLFARDTQMLLLRRLSRDGGRRVPDALGHRRCASTASTSSTSIRSCSSSSRTCRTTTSIGCAAAATTRSRSTPRTTPPRATAASPR